MCSIMCWMVPWSSHIWCRLGRNLGLSRLPLGGQGNKLDNECRYLLHKLMSLSWSRAILSSTVASFLISPAVYLAENWTSYLGLGTFLTQVQCCYSCCLWWDKVLSSPGNFATRNFEQTSNLTSSTCSTASAVCQWSMVPQVHHTHTCLLCFWTFSVGDFSLET